MTAQRIFYIAGIIGSVILLCFLVWQISEAAPSPYPPEIQKLIEEAAKVTCEIQAPHKVGVIAYMRPNEEWFVRIFTEDGQEMEMWFNESASRFALMFGITDKIYFYENGQWLDQDTLPEDKAKRLARRLKFKSEEKQILMGCLLAAREEMK
jgi:hypothetical protein